MTVDNRPPAAIGRGHPVPRRALAIIAIALGLAVVASGCTPHYELRFETSGAPLTGPQAEQHASGVDIATLASVTATDAVAMRTRVLADLRTRGDLGTRAADLLTAGFPARTTAVPVLVRASTVDAIDAIIVVEAFGGAGENLVHRRLWVFDRATGAVVRAASFR
jgi:hypothetical protein